MVLPTLYLLRAEKTTVGGMHRMRLIFIEGVSGVGKSTATAKLCEILRGKGRSADGYQEADIDNPIDLYWYAYLPKAEYDGVLVSHSDFADEIANRTVVAPDYALVRYQDFDKPRTPDIALFFTTRPP
jgi:hypothetical protein